ncbi:hypothetical protein Acj9p144 [Acinetobacter phage Acj9]|uniref:Lipoprotein n=1 Tax=Acinetobacter phage Acj9 TaxID=760939 RepID=E5EPS8_9CAUD|nr:hypothetical protein Acj9p144 [Acinetobacter phage Acj9]ADG60044.1 hypothetical protein Acj9p144 [Acinetobacter phage Acj9]
MKKLALGFVLLSIMGCSQADYETLSGVVPAGEPTTSAPEKKDFVDLNRYKDRQISFDLEFDWQYDLAERYGSIAYKAIDICSTRNDYRLTDGLDTSTEYGAHVLNEYHMAIKSCATASLEPFPQIREEDRLKVPNEESINIGLELKDDEIEGYNELPVVSYSTDDPRYPQVLKACKSNNSQIDDPVEFAEAVEFCVRKGM